MTSATGAPVVVEPRSNALRWLDLQPIHLHELPPHADVPAESGTSGHTLSAFLNSVLNEAFEIDLDGDAWVSHGRWPGTRPDYVKMAPLSGTASEPDINVLLHVEKRALGRDSSAWLARKSNHSALDVGYSELDTLLAQDHCRKEAEYTPSVVEANELLSWSAEDLEKAVTELKPEWKVKSVQMAIYQMFHEMPKALGLSLLQNRVFHILCITAHSASPTIPLSQSHTLQLPINFTSFASISLITSKSHINPTSLKYNNTHATDRQKKQNGKKFTEGVYVSLERLCEGAAEGEHRWDMMTKSDAKGITKIAPWSTRRKETLNAVSEDVKYVLDEIKKRRRAERRSAGATV